MDKVGAWAWVLVLLLVWLCVSNGDEYDEEKRNKPCLREWQTLTRAYSVYRALFPSSIAHSCWSMLKDLFHHVHVRFFPPNIDFRRGEATAGEVVTDALARSVGTSKATVHNLVKKTTSSPDTDKPKHQNEL